MLLPDAAPVDSASVSASSLFSDSALASSVSASVDSTVDDAASTLTVTGTKAPTFHSITAASTIILRAAYAVVGAVRTYEVASHCISTTMTWDRRFSWYRQEEF